MAKRQRDYQAEYRRRIELAKSKGLTTAQGRRGARKYATTPPAEHRARQQATQARHGLSPGQVTRVRRQHRAEPDMQGHRTIMFPDLDTAILYAKNELGRLESSMLKGYGRFHADANYTLVTKTGKGYAALSTRSLPSGYTEARMANIKAEASRVFAKLDRAYLVVWPFDKPPAPARRA